MSRNVGILIFDVVEVLDFCGPFEVFSVAAARGTPASNEKPFEVFTVAKTRQPISARGGLSVNPHTTLAEAPKIDVLLIPGGQGTRPLIHDADANVWCLGPEAMGHALTTAQAPELVLPDYQRTEFRLSSLRGQKVLIVTWSSW